MCSLVRVPNCGAVFNTGADQHFVSLSLSVFGARVKISAHKAQCLTGSRCNSIDVVVPFQVMLDVNAQVSVSLCFLQHCVSKGVVGYDWRSRRWYT